MESSKIGWLNGGNTFNPWIGCTPVSAACANCYAKRENARRGWCKDFNRDRHVTSDAYWRQPAAWNKRSDPARPTLVFCGSLCDVFERDTSLWNVRSRLFDVIEATPKLLWLLLTKRPENLFDMCPVSGVPENCWFGVTVENQKAADERIPVLLGFSCAGRFVSCEPLLEVVDLTRVAFPTGCFENVLKTDVNPAVAHMIPKLNGIDWVIAGGESGNGPCIRETTHFAFKSLWRDCRGHGVPFFFKQFGDRYPADLKKKDAPFSTCKEFPVRFGIK